MKKSIYVGLRLNGSEIQILDELRKKLGLSTRSDVFHFLIERYEQTQLAEVNLKYELLIKELNSLKEKMSPNHELNRYVASLLTSLVRRSAKTDPSEAEKMILKAKTEANQKNE